MRCPWQRDGALGLTGQGAGHLTEKGDGTGTRGQTQARHVYLYGARHEGPPAWSGSGLGGGPRAVLIPHGCKINDTVSVLACFVK